MRHWGDWNYGYIHAAGGLCLVMDDELWFYFGAFSGQGSVLKTGEIGAFEQDNAMYAGGSTGLATLRRDGFASLDAGPEQGVLSTRPVRFSGSRLFVNVDCPEGELRVEVVDDHGDAIPPFMASLCRPIMGNRTKAEVVWRDGGDLSPVAGRTVQFRFPAASGLPLLVLGQWQFRWPKWRLSGRRGTHPCQPTGLLRSQIPPVPAFRW